MITTTAAVSALSSFFMGLFANLPIGMAPGLGLNAYVYIQLGFFARASELSNSLPILLSVSTEPVSSVTVKPLQLFSWKGT
jgi:xanthine/uracil/vitamin C permease (AzgA family)